QEVPEVAGAGGPQAPGSARNSADSGSNPHEPGSPRPWLLPAEAERVPGRIGVDPEAGLVAGQPPGAQRQHLPLGLLDVIDPQIQVDLLRERRVGPARRLVIGCELEAQPRGLAVAGIE